MISSRTFLVACLALAAGLGGGFHTPRIGAQPVLDPSSGAGSIPIQQTLADTLTADQAVERALRENPTLQAARAEASAAEASVREVRSAWFPVVRGEASYRRLSGNIDYTVDLPAIPGTPDESVTFAPAIRDRYSTRASVEQPVFTGFRVPNQLDAAQARGQAARAEVEATRHDVAYRTRVAYWDLYRARVQARAAAKGLRLLERRLTDVRNQHDVGRATEADVLRVTARRDRVRAERIRAQNDVDSARRTLNDLMGRPLETPVVPGDTVTLEAPPQDSAVLVDRALEQRPSLQALRDRVQARAAEVDVAQSGWFPQIALTGSYLYARPNERLFPPEDQFQGTWEAGVRLSWSLSVGRQTDAATDRARAQWRQAQYQLQDRRQAVVAEVKRQVEAMTQAREAVTAARTSLQSAQAAYRAVQSRFEQGMVVVSDLLDAERALREARSQFAAAQAEYVLAQAALDRAVGRTP